MAKTDLKKGEKAALVSMLISLALAVLKAVVGFYSGAIVLVSDALDSASDVITSLAAYLGLKIAGKKPTEKFPYGYYKAESLATLVISGFIIYAAAMLLIEGYHRLFVLPSLSYPEITLAAAAFSGAVAFLVSRYLKKKGEEINSESLLANSKDRLKDVFVAVVILVAILCTHYKVPYIEGIVTIVISLLILRMGAGIVKDSVFALMDVSPSRDIEKKIKKILRSISGVESFSNLKLRKSGPFIFGEVNIKIRKYVDVERAHEVADRIEKQIKQKIRQIEAFTIHIEPFKKAKQKIVIPVKEKKALSSKVMGEFGRANYFVFVIVKGKKILKHYTKKNPYKGKKVRAGLAVVKFLLDEDIDAIVTKDIGEIAFHTMRDNLIDVYATEGKTVTQVISRFKGNKLKRLVKPTVKKE